MNQSKIAEKNIRRLLYSIVLLFIVAVIVGVIFEAQILHFSESLFSRLGPLGLVLFIGINDCFVSPVPPDLILFMLAKTVHPLSHLWLVTAMGFSSSLGGVLGWFLAKKIVKPSWFGVKIQKFIVDQHEVVNRYGKWAVALGALTPLPYSLTSWSAGFLKMNFKDFFLMSLLRIPRYLGYYLVLVFSSEIVNWIKSFT